MAPLLRPGVTVDVLAAPDSADGVTDASTLPARSIAEGVRVIAVPVAASNQSGDSSGGTLVVLGVTRSQARALAGAEAGGRLSITITAG